MAIDSADKRKSASSTVVPIMTPFAPDGTMTQPDRQHISFVYRGISAAGFGILFVSEFLVNEILSINLIVDELLDLELII